MERACRGGSSAGAHACSRDADGQTHQRRFPLGSLDPGGQHHESRAGTSRVLIRTAPAAIAPTGRECAITAGAPRRGGHPRGGHGQKAGGAEAYCRPGSARAAAWNPGDRNVQRLMVEAAARQEGFAFVCESKPFPLS